MVVPLVACSLGACRSRLLLSTPELHAMGEHMRRFGRRPLHSVATGATSPLVTSQRSSPSVKKSASGHGHAQGFRQGKRTKRSAQWSTRMQEEPAEDVPEPETTHPPYKCILVDTPKKLEEAVHDIWVNARAKPRHLFVNAEGKNMSLLNIYCGKLNTVYMFDVYTMGRRIFSQCIPEHGISLGHVLESRGTRKVFFDLRRTNIQLREKFNIKMREVTDIQLMEFEARGEPDGPLADLRRVLIKVLPKSGRPVREARQASRSRREGRQRMRDTRHEPQDILEERPLSRSMKQYCTHGVRWLGVLRQHYRQKLTKEQMDRVMEATLKKLREPEPSPQAPEVRKPHEEMRAGAITEESAKTHQEAGELKPTMAVAVAGVDGEIEASSGTNEAEVKDAAEVRSERLKPTPSDEGFSVVAEASSSVGVVEKEHVDEDSTHTETQAPGGTASEEASGMSNSGEKADVG